MNYLEKFKNSLTPEQIKEFNEMVNFNLHHVKSKMTKEQTEHLCMLIMQSKMK